MHHHAKRFTKSIVFLCALIKDWEKNPFQKNSLPKNMKNFINNNKDDLTFNDETLAFLKDGLNFLNQASASHLEHFIKMANISSEFNQNLKSDHPDNDDQLENMYLNLLWNCVESFLNVCAIPDLSPDMHIELIRQTIPYNLRPDLDDLNQSIQKFMERNQSLFEKSNSDYGLG